MMPQQPPASDVSPRSPGLLRSSLTFSRRVGPWWTKMSELLCGGRRQSGRSTSSPACAEDVSDYDDLIYEALRLVAYLERLSAERGCKRHSLRSCDTVSIRMTPDAPPGQAPLSVAYEAVSALRSYVIGSGAALYDHSLVLPARRSRQAEVYASGARFATLGQFIMSLTLPLVETLGRPEPEADEFTAAIEEKSPAGVQGTLVDLPPQPFGALLPTGWRLQPSMRRVLPRKSAQVISSYPLSASYIQRLLTRPN